MPWAWYILSVVRKRGCLKLAPAPDTVDTREYVVPAPIVGEKVNMQGVVSSALAWAIDALIATRLTAFHTRSEFVRAACFYFYETVIKDPLVKGKIGGEAKELREYVAAARRKAVALSFEEVTKAGKTAVLLLWKIEDYDGARVEYDTLLRVSRESNPYFGKLVERWSKKDSDLAGVRNHGSK